MNKLTLIILLCLFAIFAFGQDSLTTSGTFTLDQAINYALENNTDIKNAELDIIIAKKKVWETTAIGLPNITGAIAYQNTFEATTLPAFMPGQDPISFGEPQTTTADLTVSQLIFSGEYLVGLKSAKTFKSITEQSLTKTKSDIKLNVTSTFNMVLLFKERIRILKENHKNISKILEELQKTQAAGFVEETDVDQFKLTVNNIKSAIDFLENQFDVVNKNLKLALGYPFEENLEVTGNIEDQINIEEINNLLSQPFSLDANIDYQIMNTQTTVSELLLKREQSTVLPTVSAFYNHQEYLSEKPDVTFQQPDMIGLNVSIPLFASGTRHVKIQQAKMELEKTNNTKVNVGNAITMQHKQLSSELSNALKTYYNQKKSLELSKKIYDNTLVKYKEGIVSSIDLTNIQNQYLTGQDNYLDAVHKVITAQTNLKKILSNL
jgi:outer membrane protein TolC